MYKRMCTKKKEWSSCCTQANSLTQATRSITVGDSAGQWQIGAVQQGALHCSSFFYFSPPNQTPFMFMREAEL
jgi:hypothetical protein